MSVSDDSDENIFDASARPALGCDSSSSLIQCTHQDETCCEVHGEICSVDSMLESAMPPFHQTTVLHTTTDSDCKCDIQNAYRQDATVPAPLGLVECASSVGIDSAVISTHCDGTDQTTTDSLVRTDCAVKSNSCLTDTDTTEVIESSQTVKSINNSHVSSVSSSELDDELLAELENEFNCMSTVQSNSMSSDHSNVNGSLSSQVDQPSDDDLTLALASMQRRQQALECRLQNTLEARKQLETENARLECKLSASLEALEAARQDRESAKLQV